MDALQQIPFTMCMTKATLAAGTTTTFSTTNATIVAIKGKAFTISAAANAATPTPDKNTGVAFVPVTANAGSVFVFCYDNTSTTAATAIKVVQGSVQALDGSQTDGSNASAKFVVSPQFPAIPDTLCPFGYLVVKVGTSGSAWTFGTSNLSGVANTGYAFQDVITLPDRPQVA